MIKKSKMTHLLATAIMGVAIILIVFLILMFTGVLGVKTTDLTITTGSAEALYDGNPLQHHSWQISQGTLKEGHQISVEFTAEQTAVGECNNTATVIITDEVGADVTKDYNIRFEYGTLKMFPRVFCIESATDTKEYDEKPLRNQEYSLVSDYTALADGHRIIVKITGEITEIGATTNTIEEYVIVDAKGNDVSHNYHVSTREGILQIIPNSNKKILTIKTDSSYKQYDGKVLTNHSYNIVKGKLDRDHELIPTFTGEQTPAGESKNFMTATIVDENGKDVTDEYAITYQYGKLQVDPRPIYIATASAKKVYNGSVLQNHTYTLTSGSNSLVKGDKLEIIITGTITNVGQVPNTVSSLKVKNASNADVTRNYQVTIFEGTLTVIPNIIPLTISTNSAQKTYDGVELTNHNYLMRKGYLKAGHSMTVIFSGKQLTAGKSENFMHIKVTDKTGTDVTDEYEVTYQYGTLQVNPRPIKIQSHSAQKVYDGQPLQRLTYNLNGSLAPNHTLDVMISGSITDVGVHSNTISDVAIMDSNKQDVSQNYVITIAEGTLQVTPRPIRIQTEGGEKVYDGQPLRRSGYNLSGSLVKNHTLNVMISGSITDVGENLNTVSTVTIVDSSKRDVTRNYEITIFEGTLRVTPRLLQIRTEDDQKVYDGQPLQCLNYHLIDPLLKNHTINVMFSGSITDVGEKPNTVSAVIITDTLQKDVTRNYEITIFEGTLRVTPRSIRIQSESAQKVYDGQPLRCLNYNLRGSLGANHTLDVVISGMITEVGETPNTVSRVTVLDAFQKDVTRNYTITIHEGTLKVVPNIVPLTILTGSSRKTYDGSVLTDDSWTLLSGYLKPNHTIIPEFIGEQRTAGQSKNIMLAKIVDNFGKDVTSEYRIVYRFGDLIIDHRPIRIESASAYKIYDGTPLFDHTYVLTSGVDSLVSGDQLNVSISGSITEIGSTPNTVDHVKVIDSMGNDVTINYQITIYEGTLAILSPGSSGSLSGSDAPSGKLIMELYSTVTAHVYLREKSFGEYNGKEWLEATPYSKLLDDTYSMQYLPGVAFKNTSVAIASARAKFHVQDLYLLPYFLSMDKTSYQIQTSDVYCNALGNPTEYELCYYPLTGKYEIFRGKISPYASAENLYSQFVYSQYLKVDAQTKAYMTQLIREQGFKATDRDIIQKVAEYIQNAAEYNEYYPEDMDNADNPVIAFLDVYKEGVCRHYASAATLLFRTMGIPARYTVGFAADTMADEWIEVRTPGHAWVEVYIEDLGWVPVEVTPAGMMGGGGSGWFDGKIPDQKMQLELKPYNIAKLYDGKPLYAPSKVRGMEKLEVLGYTYQVTVKGERTELGITESTIESLTIFDSRGKDVTGVFDIELKPGKVQIYHTELTVQSYNFSKVYDGESGAAFRLVEGSLRKGHTYYFVPSAPTEVGKHANLVEIQILDENGNDVTGHYYVHYNVGTLEILPREISIQAGSAEKKYDGTALTKQEFTIVEGSLAPEHSIKSYTIVGSQTRVGRSDNIVTDVVIVDEEGNDVTANYQISLLPGTLKVTIH